MGASWVWSAGEDRLGRSTTCRGLVKETGHSYGAAGLTQVAGMSRNVVGKASYLVGARGDKL